MSRPDDLIQVGRVLGAYGVHGWIRIDPFGGDSSVLSKRPAIWVDEHTSSQLIKQIKFHSGALVAQLSEIGDRDAAQALRGKPLFVRRADFPAAADDEFYWVDLVGCAVINNQGHALGVVERIEDHGADAVLRVVSPAVIDPAVDTAATDKPAKPPKPRVRLIPFVGPVIGEVDLKAATITVDWDSEWE